MDALPEKPRARYTGEILLRTRPKTYYKCLRLLADPEWSINAIAQTCKVSEHTLTALRDAQTGDIAERKKQILSSMCDLATLSTERAVEKVGSASYRDAVIGAGVSVDKILALTNTVPLTTGVVIMPSEQDQAERRAIDAKLNAIALKLSVAPTNTLSLPTRPER